MVARAARATSWGHIIIDNSNTEGCISLSQIIRKQGVYIMSNETPIYDLKDLSVKLKINVRTLREYVKAGKLKAKKIGRAYYITEPNLLAFLGSDS